MTCLFQQFAVCPVYEPIKTQENLLFDLSTSGNLVTADAMFFHGSRRFHHCYRTDFDHVASTHTIKALLAQGHMRTHCESH